MAIFSIISAILALSFLIFIHELGHYFMARRVGMRVETFSIGFGRPLISWESQGVKWQIGWLLFGGYVKIAGTDTEKEGDLYQIKDGFFGKSPWDRIKVSLMGPVVNILFALLVFSLLYVSGGREKTFSEYTLKAGWIDPNSELFAAGVRPGDQLLEFNNKAYKGPQDLMYLALTSEGPIHVKGEKIDYKTKEKTPFEVDVQAYPHPFAKDKTFLTTGLLAPASYLIFDKTGHMPEGSPLINSDIHQGDRVIWVDGHVIFSLQQLSNVLNDGRSLVTIERKGKVFLARVPRIEVQELKLDPAFKEELTDWQFAAGLNAIKFLKLKTFPYNLTNDGVVENQMHFIDHEEVAFPKHPFSTLEAPLEPGDKILAVDGVKVAHSADILKQIQNRQVHIIVERPSEKVLSPSWKEADVVFNANLNQDEIDLIATTIGTKDSISSTKNLVLLKPFAPKTHQEIYAGAQFEEELEKQKKLLSEIDDQDSRLLVQKAFNEKNSKFELGLPVRDLKVEYNPIPTDQFMTVFNEISRTLKALFSGSLNPKYMSGPVGIVAMFQEQTKTGLGDALYWLGAISLNLGVLNLLPIPMLDGGTIMLSLFEGVSGRKIKPKTMERLILPFAIILMVFFVFLTFHDLSRLFGGFFKW